MDHASQGATPFMGHTQEMQLQTGQTKLTHFFQEKTAGRATAITQETSCDQLSKHQGPLLLKPTSLWFWPFHSCSSCLSLQPSTDTYLNSLGPIFLILKVSIIKWPTWNSLLAQWVKISALSLLRLRLLLWLRFGLWPWNIHIPQVQPKNNKNSPNSLPYGVIARIK